MMKSGISIAALALCIAAPAQAVTITQTLDITGTDFALQFGDGSVRPIEPANIRFSLTFDNAFDVDPTTNGLSILSTNLPYMFQYAYGAASDSLTLSTNPVGIGGCANPANSSCLFISSFSTAPRTFFFQQSTASDGFWVAGSVVTNIVAPVPEPGTWAMMIVGFGMAGGALRYRRRSTKVAFATA